MTSFFYHFLGMADPPPDRASSRNRGAGKVDFTFNMAHSSSKIAVGRGQSPFPSSQNTHMSAQAGTAGGWTDDSAC